MIYGGNGTAAAVDDEGDLSLNGRARDADVILGDNANIIRLVGVNGVNAGAFLSFGYAVEGTAEIIVRGARELAVAGQARAVQELGRGIADGAGDAALKFGPIMATKMMCPPPLMSLESAFQNVIGRTAGFKLDGDKLRLINGSNTVLATFTRKN